MPRPSSPKALEIFEQVSELPVDDRISFLDSACKDDRELRAEVGSLLAHEAQVPASFMNVSSGERPHNLADGDEVLVGHVISRFQITRIIASGGMGTVFAAAQERPTRTVALKVLRLNLYSQSALRRFEHESEVLGRLQHPNIAQIHEAGTFRDPASEQDRPYFAMEYVPLAQSITSYANSRQLDVHERLRLFLQACEAVRHGHQKGIIHRDLKPSNILVGEGELAKVIDFGVARAADSDIALTTMHTEVGQLVGTLQYMSPEQCDGDPHELDMRSDVYSLGLVLFELLTGRKPYDADTGSVYQVTRVIKEVEPIRPSSLDRHLRGDLDTIVLKALEKDRTQRYQSVDDLARDIQHHLDREPIEAKPLTTWVRFVRWAARHPVIVTSLMCVAAVAGVLGGGLYSVWRFNRQPYRIELANFEEARLLSRGNGVLHIWEAEDQGRINCAALITQEAQHGAGQFALIGFADKGPLRNPRGLAWYNVNKSVKAPELVDTISEKDIPDRFRDAGILGVEFTPARIWQIDIFDEVPGSEVLVSWHHDPGSPFTLRIYDQAGRILFQFWHVGGVQSVYWLSESQLLVCAGVNADGDWPARGYDDAVSPYPQVVFAIRPELGLRSREIVNPDQANGDVHLAWYRCFLPPHVAGQFSLLRLSAPFRRFDRTSYLQYNVRLKSQPEIGVGFVLGAEGNEILEGRTPDAALVLSASAPDIGLLRFGGMPSIVDPRDVQKEPNQSSQPDP